MMGRSPIRHLRWYIVGLLCLASALNYLDRQTLSVLAKTIQDRLHLTNADYANITTTFLISYTIMCLVGGRLVDVLGVRRSFQIFVSGWSLANILHAFARSALQLTAFRFLLGAMEPANFPAGVKAVSEWFPVKERALAVGIFNAGTSIGAVVAIPLVSFMALHFGWQSAFVATGAVGLVWVLAWSRFYYAPQEHPRLGADERVLILGDQPPPSAGPEKAVPVRRLLAMRETWGCVLARVCTDPISYFLGFWIPLYFEKERGLSLNQIGAFLWIPYVAFTLGHFSSGAIPRLLIASGWSVNRARKTTMLAVSCAMLVCWLGITQAQSAAAAVTLMAAIMFGHAAWGNITLPAEVFPKNAIGTVSGLGGALGGLAGAITQQLVGRVVDHVSFAPIFIAGAGLYLLAFLLVHVLIGELGVIRNLEPGN